MSESSIVLSKIFEGWDGYQTSMLHSVQALSHDQLKWRPAPKLRSIGELTAHIALGRLGWFVRLQAPGALSCINRRSRWLGRGNFRQAEEILHWLEVTWAGNRRQPQPVDG